jgi:hypothetical protein
MNPVAPSGPGFWQDTCYNKDAIFFYHAEKIGFRKRMAS